MVALFGFMLFGLLAHTPTGPRVYNRGAPKRPVSTQGTRRDRPIQSKLATDPAAPSTAPTDPPPPADPLPTSTAAVTTATVEYPPAVRPSKPPPPSWGTLLLLPRTSANDSPSCLDGSPFGFNYRLSSHGSTRWTFTLPGGGWCHTLAECASWTSESLGSSKKWGEPGTGAGKGTAWGESPQGHSCEAADHNCVYLKYCDGGSFSGARPGSIVVPMPNKPNVTLYFRGLRNFDAAVAWALRHGLDRATEVVLTGISAGGLATLVHLDRLASRLPTGCRVRGLPIDGFFISRPSYLGQASRFEANFRKMVRTMRITGGPGGALPRACVADNPEAPEKCLLSAVLQSYVRTPFFLMQTKFDQWQLANVVGLPWSNCIISNHNADCNSTESTQQQPHVLTFARELLDDLAPLISSAAERGNSGFVSSCICHYRCPYGNLTMPSGGPSATAFFEAWLQGEPGANGRFLVDGSKYPNGDGALLKLPSSGLSPLYAQSCTPLSKNRAGTTK